jgi:hypothetical protein
LSREVRNINKVYADEKERPRETNDKFHGADSSETGVMHTSETVAEQFPRKDTLKGILAEPFGGFQCEE